MRQQRMVDEVTGSVALRMRASVYFRGDNRDVSSLVRSGISITS